MKHLCRCILFAALVLIAVSLLTGKALAEPPQRIVSLAPNITELLFSLGLADRIAGVTSFCDTPDRARKLPKVGGMSNPSLEAILKLRPDLVVITPDGNPRWIKDRLAELGIASYVFSAKTLRGLPAAVRDLGKHAGADEAGWRLALEIDAALGKMAAQTLPGGHKGRVLFVIWPDPLIVAGPDTVIDEAITMLGWENGARDAVAPYPKFSLEQVIRRSPDVLVIGKGHEDMARLSRGLIERIEGSGAKPTIAFVSDALYRLGPRVIEGIRELSGALERPSQ